MTTAFMIKFAPILLGLLILLAKKASEAAAAKQAVRAAAEKSGPSAPKASGQETMQASVSPSAPLTGPRVLARGAPKGTMRGAATAGAAKTPRAPSSSSVNQASRATAAAAKATPMVVSDRDLDSGAAMRSRQHLAEQVAKIRQAEAKVSAAGGIRADHSAMKRAAPAARLTSAEIQKSLRDPRQIRKSIVLCEILGRPRGAQGF